ncbi:sensor histidine kinase [Catalinimonas niigatensis]|uniref:sensor histidine kinase n=1 Tax=Catalinimonas niigatensis TaxID=1397264 RepID=UPI00266544E8|nr:sensor histidine kinase [Catalinimonas niigatensis]WPP49776.1 sensor histidine kinase [Catalinimonas niigatensis]
MEKVQKPIIEVSLDRELDLVIAYKKAMRLAEISGLNFTDQTKFATAVSEISRNALAYARKGKVTFFIVKEDVGYYVQAIITDQGPGISNLGTLLQKLDSQTNRQQTGIMNCKRLSDKFDMDSGAGKGTCVKIFMRLPVGHPPINSLILSGWRNHFSQLAPISPYDELKQQNHLLLKVLEELRIKESQTKEQIKKIQSLNTELEHNYIKIKELSKDYAIQNELLLKRNKELDDFAHIVSHDLKAPILNLKGIIQLIEDGKLNDQEKMFSIFKGQLKKMENLIECILTYSRAGHEKVDKTRLDIKEFLTTMIKNLAMPDSFHVETEDELPILFTEEIFVEQVFSNLLSNAIKYNNKQEGKVKVGIERNTEDEIIYFVEDNGPGIPLNKREAVFNMFTILQKKKDVNSTGIGLAIVKKIINEKGGKIWIEDAVEWDTGSRFCFTWPVEVVH